MHKYNNKKIFISVFVVTIISCFAGRQLEWQNLKSIEQTQNEANVLQALRNPVEQQLTFGFVGDIMLDRDVRNSVNKNYDGDYSRLFANTDFLSKPDITFANLEGPVSDTGKDKHNLYSFRMDPAVLPVIKKAGIDVVSFANNHVLDWGRPAFEDTLKRLNENGILACGAGMNRDEASTPAIINQNGYKIGFLCFTDVGPNFSATATSSGILLASDPDFSDIIKAAKYQVDELIVSFHSGVEYQPIHNSRQEQIFKKAVDSGADLVVGAHPHVAEDFQTYKNTTMMYSLGNFIFDQSFSKETMQGLFVTATLKDKKFVDITPHTVVLNKHYAPSLK
jgi:poly-gamma-glutamate capsule biosynthesis protein CapA/YwtB (metallophosphatase superfamily)